MPVLNGLKLRPIDIAQDYVLGGYGSLGGPALQPDGQWLDYLPENESQLDAAGFDAIACTSFATLSALEMLNRRLYGTNRNWSDRFLAKASNTTKEGNDPHIVCETLRKVGAPNEADYPYPPTIASWDDFYAAIPKAVYSLATAFIAEFAFFHEYVVTQPSYLKTALTYSPVCVSVTAWYQDGEYYVHQAGIPDNHWTVLVGYKEGAYWLCYDSYDPSTLKKLRWDFKFAIAKRYQLARQVEDNRSWAQWLVDLVRAAFSLPLPATPTTPVTIPSPEPAKPHVSRIPKFCEAIKRHEGWYVGSRSQRNNNPGNCRYSSVGYASVYGKVGKDAQNFAVFRDYTTGWLYLNNLVKEKIRKHPQRDFYAFFEEYAPSFENDSRHYAEVVAKACGVPPTTPVKDLL